MATFAMTTVASAEYKEETRWRGRLVVRYKESEADGVATCAEAVLDEGYDKDALKAEYEAWKAAREASALAAAIRGKQEEINAYDVSEAVNSFTLKHGDTSLSYWLPAQQRNQLVTSVTAWGNSHETYRLDLREYGTYIDVGCNDLLSMLSKLEDYAVGCYNATSANLAAVARLTTVAEVEGYDITQGYPERLTFEA